MEDKEFLEALDFLISISKKETKVVNNIIILDSNNESDREWFDNDI
ncbi:hypothetical protein NGG06_09835 [Enterococcus faecium]|nr:hypothetical protein [Enterococcus faecium]MEB7477968.1 hypothetical protein [Enterococcus faecium]MEB8314817.1 hypothetical protein [Enterococcus faecium]MEB8450566.1 hypothetical protein [Enterococcus faecium]